VARRRPGRGEPADAPERDLGPGADPESVARTILLTKLTGRARSRRELADALAATGVPDEVAASVLDRFERVGLVDDQAFADAWVESRQRSRGLSRRAIAQELRRKGVDDDVARGSLERVDDEQERRTARALVDRKLRSLGTLDEATRFRRLTGLLARKGYSGGVSVAVVRRALSDERCRQAPDLPDPWLDVPVDEPALDDLDAQ
jgi:regulatory protein